MNACVQCDTLSVTCFLLKNISQLKTTMAVTSSTSNEVTLITSVPAPSAVGEEDGDRGSSCLSLSQHGRGLLRVHWLGASYKQSAS